METIILKLTRKYWKRIVVRLLQDAGRKGIINQEQFTLIVTLLEKIQL